MGPDRSGGFYPRRMTDDSFLVQLEALMKHTPPAVFEEEQLPDGSLVIKFRGPGPHHADNGTLTIPACALASFEG